MPRREGAYRVYLVVAVGLVAVAPLVRMLFLALLEPASLAWLSSNGFSAQLRAVAATVVPFGLLVGTVRGPALLRPFDTVTLGSNHLPRRTTLRRPMLRSLLVASLVAATLVALPATALVVGVGASALAAASCAAAAVALACLGVVAALVGQVVGTRLAWALAAALGAFGISPVGIGIWFEATWGELAGVAARSGLDSAAPAGGWLSTGLGEGAGGAFAGLVLLIGVAAATVSLTPRLLDRLRGGVLLRQAGRREAATMSVATGELSGVAASYREAPSTGRRLRAVVGGPRIFAFLVRDAAGALRTPQRTVLGLLGLGIAALLTGWLAGLGGVDPSSAAFAATAATTATSASASPAASSAMGDGALALALAGAVVTAAAGAVAVYLALGAFSEGFRHAAESAGGAAMFGTPVGEQFLLHAVFPLVLVLIVFGSVALLTGGAFWGGFAPLVAAVAMVAVRAFESARGHLPPLLLTPIPSEIGDLSVIARLAWQFDSLIIAAVLGVATTLLWNVGLPALSLAALAASALLLALATRSRLRQGRG